MIKGMIFGGEKKTFVQKFSFHKFSLLDNPGIPTFH